MLWENSAIVKWINAKATKQVAELLAKLTWRDKIDLMKAGHFRTKIIDNPNLTQEDIDKELAEYRARQSQQQSHSINTELYWDHVETKEEIIERSTNTNEGITTWIEDFDNLIAGVD